MNANTLLKWKLLSVQSYVHLAALLEKPGLTVMELQGEVAKRLDREPGVIQTNTTHQSLDALMREGMASKETRAGFAAARWSTTAEGRDALSRYRRAIA